MVDYGYLRSSVLVVPNLFEKPPEDGDVPQICPSSVTESILTYARVTDSIITS